ncbi:hypothetical protein SASPL_143552 [Salvia splendens]|uniref:Uncharacterized protein n=1 Tax=Salvia splendens TaxID=180675 RepID=A0A8X8WMU8_SALSN|nr:hypothetical protein SASPL_143552 [Salvia splendens]
MFTFKLGNWLIRVFSLDRLRRILAGERFIMFATAVRYIAKKPKPKMKPIELKTPPEQTQTITRVIFDVLKEHGPLTIADTWEHVKQSCGVWIWFDFVYVHNMNTPISDDHIRVKEWLMMVLSPD